VHIKKFYNPIKIKLKTYSASKNSYGKLSLIDLKKDLPFKISRIFFSYKVHKNFSRGGHAHKKNYQCLIAISGRLLIHTINSKKKIKNFILNKPNIALLIPKNTWAELKNYSKDCVCLVFASGTYNASEYIRNKKLYL
jgi:dTDP-4-dehydrorhamnose 3,5-epimerase-like enzyme